MQLKVVTLNIWNGGRLFDQARAFLQAQQADVIFIQEAYHGLNPAFDDRFRTVSLLRAACPDFYLDFAPLYLDTRAQEGPIEEGQLILSRWPLTAGSSIFFDIPYGEYDQDRHPDFSFFPAMVQGVTMMVAGQSVKLLNVHGPVNNDGTADTDRRMRMRDVLLQAASGDWPVILGGDFNVQPQTETMRSLATLLTPVFAEGELTSTFNMERKTQVGFATAAVDNLYVSRHFKVIERECPPVDISDHLPLVATIEL